jgi:CRISPR-associated protein Csb1
MINLTPLETAPRLLLEAKLKPVQGDRFQPTGFPDLGAATYTLHDGTQMLLVESAQSMANRAESACWNDAERKLVSTLDGLPYIQVDISDGTDTVAVTSSVLESHRLNSPYVLDGVMGGKAFKEILLEAAGFKAGQPIDHHRFLTTAFRYDPCSLLHGLFMSQVEDGRLRFARSMSAFIEARGVRVAQSGGVKNDRVNPSGEAEKGFGNVPFARTEYTAETMTAFMNLDLRQIRSFGLPAQAVQLLQQLALYKFRKLLRDNLRLRTACDLVAVEVRATAPEGFTVPSLEELENLLPTSIQDCADLFAKPAVTRLVFTQTTASTKASKKAGKGKDKVEVAK